MQLLKLPMLLFPDPFKNWDQCETRTVCNIFWYKISFHPVQVTALNWGLLASNILSVICQGIVLLGGKVSESSPPGLGWVVSEVQQSMMWIVSEDCGGFVVAVDWWGLFIKKYCEGSERGERNTEILEEGGKSNGFFHLRRISWYIQDLLRGRMRRIRGNVRGNRDVCTGKSCGSVFNQMTLATVSDEVLQGGRRTYCLVAFCPALCLSVLITVKQNQTEL